MIVSLVRSCSPAFTQPWVTILSTIRWAHTSYTETLSANLHLVDLRCSNTQTRMHSVITTTFLWALGLGLGSAVLYTLILSACRALPKVYDGQEFHVLGVWFTQGGGLQLSVCMYIQSYFNPEGYFCLNVFYCEEILSSMVNVCQSCKLSLW